ncbi:MAG TPA: hypothetical protein VFC33_08485 [Acidimicrobiia bacterium]|nr:hypothetical protein [Acidimicrobiia bacterium]
MATPKAAARSTTPKKTTAKKTTAPQAAAGDHARGQRAAAHRAVRRINLDVHLPVIGEVVLPEPAHLAWYAGLATLAALEIVEWPIAVVLAIGKALADNHGNHALEEFGQALEEGG